MTGNEAAKINYRNARGNAAEQKAQHFSQSATQNSFADINRMPPNDQPQPMVGPTPQDQGAAKQLDAATAKSILAEAGGDKEKARALAAQRGYTF